VLMHSHYARADLCDDYCVEALPIPATNDDDSAMKPFVDSMMSAMSCGKDRDKLSAVGAATHDQTGSIARAMTS
jgi:hypothetical protein